MTRMIRTGSARGPAASLRSAGSFGRNVKSGKGDRQVGNDLTAVVVDEWELVGAGVSGVLAELGVATVARARDSRAGVRAARQAKADIVVMGTCTDGPLGQGLRAARALNPMPRVFLLVTAADHDELPHLLASGADAILIRSSTLEELADSFGRAVKGERVIAPALLPTLLGSVTPKLLAPSKKVLTKREEDMLSRIAQGRTNREIAEELFLGEETVKSHLSKLYAKLDATDRRDAVARALAVGLLG